MSRVVIKTEGFKEFEAAIAKNPQVVYVRGREFLNRALMAYRRKIEGAPWRVGQSGGGAPYATGDLQKSHRYRVNGLQGKVDFDENPNPSKADAPSGFFVHEGTRKMRARPWLDFAVTSGYGEVTQLYKKFLDNVVHALAK